MKQANKFMVLCSKRRAEWNIQSETNIIIKIHSIGIIIRHRVPLLSSSHKRRAKKGLTEGERRTIRVI